MAGPFGKVLTVKRMKSNAVAYLLMLSLSILALPAAALEADKEFEFASGLVELGFADLANTVVEQILRRHPDERDRATRIRGEILVAQRRFADAEELVKTMPEGHTQRYALKLRIANGHFRAGNIEEAQRLYDAFFSVYEDRTPTDPDLLRFYQDAAYQYGQMLERMGNRAGAAEAYHRLLRSEMEDEGAMRRLQMDLARLYLQLGREASGSERERFLDLAFEMCEEVQWGGYDLWFGQSISLMAHVELTRGNEEAARELLQSYMSDLQRLDRLLREQNIPAALSPVANARFLLGELYEKQVHALREAGAPESQVLTAIQRALTEFYNVFGQYGGSEWGGEAGTRGRALVQLLQDDYGRQVNIDFGEHVAQAAQAQFTLADDLFRQRNFERAVEEYLRILTSFPEGEPSKRALANLLMSYVQLDDPLYVEMMVAYLSERFSNNEILGNAILLATRHYAEKRDEEMFATIVNYFFDGFPEHDRAPQLLFDMARRSERAGDLEQAANYYERIIANYPRHRFFLRALMARALLHHQQEEFAEAAPLFERFVAETPPGHNRVRAQFMLADSFQRQRKFREAVQAYRRVVEWMSADEPVDNVTAEDVERNERLAERALFFTGFSFGRMQEPAAQRSAFADRGILIYRQFLGRHPESSLAPRAMRDKGALLLELGRTEEAAEVFETLARRYPDSEEGRNALFELVRSAFEIGNRDIARDAFRQMIEAPDNYSPEEFTRIGQLMLENGMYDDVIPAYRQVVATTEERRMLELALFGLGSAYSQQGDHGEAVTMLNDLLERFPNSPFFYDAKFLLADAHLQRQEFRESNAALADILRLSQDNLINQRAQFKLGQLQAARGDKQQALASFQRIALLQDPANADLRPIIEESLMKSLNLMMELELYSDVRAVFDQFQEDFAGSPRIDEARRIRDAARSSERR